MKLTESFKKDTPTLSFEFFPPKTPKKEEELFEVIEQLKVFGPDFVSVTYGAMGTDREKTFFWAREIKKRFGIESIAHLTCVAASKGDIKKQIEYLKSIGILNVLALRGDPPQGEERFVPPQDGFKYARDLIAFIRGLELGICVGAAGYPEKHLEAVSLDHDIEHLKEKVEAGAEYIITQLFFDNQYYFDFVKKCRSKGITVPIIPGIMAIISKHQIEKMTKMCGASIPAGLKKELDAAKDEEAVRALGIKQAVKQCRQLLDNKVKGLHFFVLNRSGPISKILKELDWRK